MIWLWSGAALFALAVYYFRALLPLARTGDLSPFQVFIATVLLFAGVQGFFLKRLWGIVAFAAGEAYLLSWHAGPFVRDGAIALGFVVLMIAIAGVHRREFRVF